MINDFIFSLSYAFLHHNTVLFVVIDFSINLSRYMELVIAWIIFLIFPKKTDFWKQMFLELHLRIINDNSKLSFYQFSIFSNCDDFYLNSNDTWGCCLFVFCIWYFKEMKKSFFFYYLKKKKYCPIRTNDSNHYILSVWGHMCMWQTQYYKQSSQTWFRTSFPSLSKFFACGPPVSLFSIFICLSDVSKPLGSLVHILC